MKRAFITGVTGQDGSYLVDLLVAKDYDVHGLVRQSTQFTPDKWSHLKQHMKTGKLQVHYGDLGDSFRLQSIIESIAPDEVYNLAAQSHVGQSFEQPQNTCEVTAMGPLRVIDAVHRTVLRTGANIRFYQASSSEMFGKVLETPQTETTGFYPRSPYGCAKAFAHYITKNYREAYGLFATSGILFNHESERRGEDFVTRKITRALGRIVAGTQSELVLGNTDARRDWGYAPDYVEAMWLMLQQPKPDDFVIGTGEVHSVQEFIDMAFGVVNLDPKDFVKQNPKFMRPSEVDTLCANPAKAKAVMGWQPKVSFQEMVQKMVEHDIQLAIKEKVDTE